VIFNNKPNKEHKIDDTIFWESRSVAVVATILALYNNEIYVLASKRGYNSADYQGLYNVVAGYLDWNEDGTEAVCREVWEECGLNLPKFISDNTVIEYHLDNPWKVITSPKVNRQNVSLRYGVYIKCDSLPELSLENNEIEGECEDVQWMPLKYIDSHEWAFNHDTLIKEYVSLLKISYNYEI
jgi:8-oxo-dGTP pyrophosphatase MutT (NUDIX family)